MKGSTPCQSSFFTLEQVSDGIFAAIALPGVGAIGNASIIDLGEKTLVFDTMYTPQAGQSLRAAAEGLFDRPVSLVINSHFHMDHVGGNQVFADALIFSTEMTRTLMQERCQQMLAYAKAHPEYPDTVRESLELEQDGEKRKQLAHQLGDVLALDAALPTMVPHPASVTYARSITLHGSKRTAVLTAMGNGHSPCDSILYLPDDGVLLAADLVFVKSHPSVQSGDALEWIKILDELKKLSFHTVIPGHGPIAGKQSLDDLQRYLSALIDRASEIRQAGDIPEKSAAFAIPDAYLDWTVPGLYERNLRHLIQ